MTVRSSLHIALRALARNRLQTALTMVGMTIGVATVLTMISVGRGGESAIEDQVRAAGMNLIVVTAGNYKVKTDEDFGVVEPSAFLHDRRRAGIALRPAIWNPQDPLPLVLVHPEDDPLEKHDHPLASQRLGDAEAGLGAAATLSSGDAGAIRKLPGVQFVSEGVHQNVHVLAGQKPCGHRMLHDHFSRPKNPPAADLSPR